ncbi:glycoside hydrolase family 16 protein [Clostridium botulinum]|uniref:Endo-1,3(4)-beta-glucanase n=1 Tax=Clostridium botulinum TaxID=1491 RepID=A0A9Q1V1J5_CLOBO|nr:glycoside hydrolase family 16 protein [Clostridium botulinum]AEB76839.1 putative endo-1,3(4)-beta-glucanase [Clostridium botulinum BKT015925]KEI02364.1 endo-1,3(4)-beta-glucanase [Clostridium botulinum C/D str. Sp77]KEI02580.1 endo-1,3(4)-beta-glucanase [Clostridium botulinum D str. 16868]KLU76679.1 endo-1,3(4)-beta-glucanase [Clostridium botulinum V891]KOA74110.1 endo-1,3(4)-beta-glucanase [Clostridium botulinum]
MKLNKKVLISTAIVYISLSSIFSVYATENTSSRASVVVKPEKVKIENTTTDAQKTIKVDDEKYNLVWQDEFNENKLDTTKWRYRYTPENGSMKYTNKPENVYFENGNLVLSALPIKGEKPLMKNGKPYSSTSGNVSTQGIAFWKYGRIDVRAKIPMEMGMWPAIWMMPEANPYGWPNDGEIDIMEALGSEKNIVYGTLHTGNIDDPKNHTRTSTGVTYKLQKGTLADDYHIYSVIWKEKSFEFLIDNKSIGKINSWPSKFKVTDIRTGKEKVLDPAFPDPFNKPFYLILNLGVGGGWGGEPNTTTSWGDKTKMFVDYVRVYQKDNSNLSKGTKTTICKLCSYISQKYFNLMKNN